MEKKRVSFVIEESTPMVQQRGAGTFVVKDGMLVRKGPKVWTRSGNISGGKRRAMVRAGLVPYAPAVEESVTPKPKRVRKVKKEV